MTLQFFKKGEWGAVRAFFDVVTKEGFILKGFKLVDGSNGMFISYPSQQNQKDGKYYDTVLATKELRDELTKMVYKAYGMDIMASTNETENAKEDKSENVFDKYIPKDDIDDFEDIPF